MDWWIVLAIFLYFLAGALIVAEVFIPSWGLITMCSLACLAGGLVIFFDHSATAGWIGVLIAVIMVPSVVVGAYKVFPYTRFGKRVLLTPQLREPGEAIPDISELKELLGASATVITTLRPVGMCDFSGRRLECVAESGFIEKGKLVKVIKVEGTQLMVRLIQQN